MATKDGPISKAEAYAREINSGIRITIRDSGVKAGEFFRPYVTLDAASDKLIILFWVVRANGSEKPLKYVIQFSLIHLYAESTEGDPKTTSHTLWISHPLSAKARLSGLSFKADSKMDQFRVPAVAINCTATRTIPMI